jgi:hypothetical protein
MAALSPSRLLLDHDLDVLAESRQKTHQAGAREIGP